MGDIIVLALLGIGLFFIGRYIFLSRIKAKGKGEAACIGCSASSCSTCDPITLKNNLKEELKKNSCCS